MHLRRWLSDRLARRTEAASPVRGPQPWPEPKEEFARELEERLRELSQRIDLLRRGAGRRSAAERVELLDRLAGLRDRVEQLQRALGAYRAEEGVDWDRFRRKAEARWAELRRELVDATERYRRSRPQRAPRPAAGASAGGTGVGPRAGAPAPGRGSRPSRPTA